MSADSTAAGAIRVMPPCMGMGQAAGVAAALSVQRGQTVRDLDPQVLRAQLRGRGVHLGDENDSFLPKFGTLQIRSKRVSEKVVVGSNPAMMNK